MRIKLGTSRIVLLTESRAIKIARIRPIGSLRFIAFPFFSDEKRLRLHAKYGTSFCMMIFRYIFFGFYANILECEYYQAHTEDDRVAPTVAHLCWSIVVTQEIGDEVTLDMLKEFGPFKGLTPYKYQDTNGPNQYAWIRKKIRLIDYGNPETCRFLRDTYAQ